MRNPLIIHGSTNPLYQELVPLQIGDFKFPLECLVDIRGGKDIIKTKIPGMDGSIKEYAGMDDYTITVRAILQGTNYDYVMDQLADLITVWETEGSIKIVCPKTEAYGIDRVVFESISHPETEGMEATEILSLTFTSDKDYNFEVIT